MIRLRLCENMRAFGYAPFYYALSQGYFQQAGLDITLITSPDASQTGSMLLHGKADISWGGPMRVMLHHQADPHCPLVCFTQIVARDPFVLLGRTPRPQFRFSDLQDLRVAVATEVPTPWLMFQDDLARAGCDPSQLRRVPTPTMAQGAAALLAGTADAAQVFEPFVDELCAAGCHVWHRFSTRGDIAYTTFYAQRDVVMHQREMCRRLVRGMAAAQAQFHITPPQHAATAIASFFPDWPATKLARMLASYRQAGLWAATPELPLSAFLRLKAALVSGGLITHDFPFDLIVDPGLSRNQPV
ncbi:MAG TPA: ABC transporter substrate-binding protein [Acetobacteraceae bacterium]